MGPSSHGLGAAVLLGTCPVAAWERTCLPTQETGVQFLGREDLLVKEMATHFGVPAGEIPWTEGPAGLQPTVSRSPTQL